VQFLEPAHVPRCVCLFCSETPVTPPANSPVAGPLILDLRAANPALSRLLGFLKSLYHAARNFPDRVVHHRRHRSVLRRISQMSRPQRVLVVCHGNICRSPYLQAVLQRAAPDIAVSSAGFIGGNRAVPPFSLEVSARRGLDLSHFRSQIVSPENVLGSDLIVVMEPDQAEHIRHRFRVSGARLVVAGDLDPNVCPTRAIPDPWMQPVESFESSFDRLDRCAEALVSALRQQA
jgi:protein-tyrosine phosphatase